MPTRRHVLDSARGALGLGTAFGLAGCTLGGGNGGGETPTLTPATEGGDAAIASPAFDDGATIPAKYTCDGADVSPPLSPEVPDGAASLALVVDDPDAPREEPFVHWLLWNVPADTTTIPEDVPGGETVDALGGARQGTTSFDDVGYGGPCPPEGDGPHTYRFMLFALDGELDLAAGARRDALTEAMQGRVLARATLTGEFER